VRLVMVPWARAGWSCWKRLRMIPLSQVHRQARRSLHHVCIRVPDLAEAVAKLKNDGVRMVSNEIKTGAGGHRYVFVHPQSARGCCWS